jgi:imidazolonepropionase-like amidohydrolase
MRSIRLLTVLSITLLLLNCAGPPPEPEEGLYAFVGAAVIDGSGNPPIEDAVLIVRDGRIEDVGTKEDLPPPATANLVDVSGKTIIPGLINAHGHVGQTHGLESGPDVYSKDNVLAQLQLYARYGVTTVVSLGGDGPEAIELRDEQDTKDLDRARIYVAGSVVVGRTPAAVTKMIDDNAAMKVDWIKIRVDDNLGSSRKMRPNVYQAVIEHAHRKGIRVAAHLYYLNDAKGLLDKEVDFIVHSVRDQEVDQELIDALLSKEVCLCPTLTREVSTFVYESEPDFFADPFFQKETDPDVIEQLKDPERQKKIQQSKSAQQYKKALQVASANLKKLADAGVTIAFGTDTGPPARFQGYFEHMELDLMVKAGLTPMQAIMAATGQAADCLNLHRVGTLTQGKWADMIVLNEDPLADINNTKTVDSVYIAGNKVPGK